MSEKEQKTERKQTTDNNSAKNEGSVDEGKKQSTTLFKNILESQIDSQSQIKVTIKQA